MKPDLIDIQVESRGNDVELSLSGSLGLVQLTAVKEKLDMLVEGPGCFYFLNLQNAHFTSDRYLDVFLELLNRVKSQKSALILIFDSAELYDYFSKYLNIFEVYENRKAYKKSGTKPTIAATRKNLRIWPSVQALGKKLLSGVRGMPPMHLMKTGSTRTEVSILKKTPADATTPNS